MMRRKSLIASAVSASHYRRWIDGDSDQCKADEETCRLPSKFSRSRGGSEKDAFTKVTNAFDEANPRV